ATGSYDQTARLWAAPLPPAALPPWSLRGTEGVPFGKESAGAKDDWPGELGRVMQFKELLESKRRALEEDPANRAYPRELAEGSFALAPVLAGRGQREAAVSAMRHTLAFRRKLAEAEPDNEEVQVKLADDYSNLGDLERSAGDNEAALENGRRGLEMRKK